MGYKNDPSKFGYRPKDFDLLQAQGAMRPVPNFPGYFADHSGHIWSQAKKQPWLKRRMAPRLNQSGYPWLGILDPEGKGRVYRCVHVLVATAWHGPRPTPTHHVRHLDGDKLNNAPENLAYGTAKENHEDRERHGRVPRGEDNVSSALSAAEVSLIKEMLERGARPSYLAPLFDVHQTTIKSIESGRTWRDVPRALAKLAESP